MAKVKRKRRKDGRLKDYVFLGYHADGTENRKYVYAYTEKELDQKLLELKMTIAKGEFISNDSVTLKEWADVWLKTYKAGKEYKTYQMYDVTIRNHIVKELGHLKLVDLKPFHIQGLINNRYKQGLTKTLRNIKLTLNQMFEQAIENELMIKNPAKRVEIPRVDKEDRRPLTDEELKYLDLAEFTLKEKAFVCVCTYAGLRRGEALALTKNDIKKGVISVTKTIVFKNNQPELKNHTKTDAGMREVPIIEELKSVLDAFVKTVKGIYLFQPQKSNGLMTETAFRSMWSCIWRKLNKAAGGKHDVIAYAKITPHMLRHTYATMLYYAGVDIKMAQYLMGHASAETTLEIYTHLKMKESAPSKKLNKYISQLKKDNKKAFRLKKGYSFSTGSRRGQTATSIPS